MDYVMLAVGLLLTVGTGLFVASEFALVNLDRADLEARQAAGESRLSLTISALKITSTHLSSAQLGITLTTLLTGYTMEPALSNLLAPPLTAWGVPEAAVRPIGTIVATTIATIFSMILGELVPKNLALAIPRATAKVVMPFQVAFTTVFRPAVSVLNGSANAVLRSMGVEPKEELSGARSAEELSSLVRRSASAGVLEEDTATLLDRTLTFARLTTADVMTPRPSVHAIAAGDSVADVIQLARRTGHSRFPVFNESMDDITGIVHLKQAVAVPRDRRPEVPAAAIAEEPLRVPEAVHLDAVMAELRSRGYQMAVVVDEYGGTAGVVTLEDLVEEIVGEVLDEHDRNRAGIVRTREGVIFPGELRPDELLDRTGIRVPEGEEYDTVGGFLMSSLQRIPTVGDRVEIEDGSLIVQRIDGRRVDRVRFVPAPVPDGAESASDEEGATMNDWAGIAWLVVLLAFNAFFVASEFAVISARRSQIEPLADKGSRRAKTALWAMEHATLMLATCQLGITICSLLILNVSEPAIHHLLEDPLGLTGWSEAVIGAVAFVIALLLVSYLHVVFGEMVPKNLAFSLPDRAVLILATPLVWASRVFHPVIVALNWLANHLVRLVGVEPKNEAASTFTLEEVATIVNQSRIEGVLEDTSGAVAAAVEFTDKKAEDVAVPLSELVTLPESTTPDDIEAAVARYGYSRYVIVDAAGEPVGYVHLKDVLREAEGPESATWADAPIKAKRIHHMVSVGEQTDLEDALAVMRRSSRHLAQVRDGSGRVTGVLFLEDIIEELVGEVHDATTRRGRHGRAGSENARG